MLWCFRSNALVGGGHGWTGCLPWLRVVSVAAASTAATQPLHTPLLCPHPALHCPTCSPSIPPPPDSISSGVRAGQRFWPYPSSHIPQGMPSYSTRLGTISAAVQSIDDRFHTCTLRARRLQKPPTLHTRKPPRGLAVVSKRWFSFQQDICNNCKYFEGIRKRCERGKKICNLHKNCFTL